MVVRFFFLAASEKLCCVSSYYINLDLRFFCQ